jgi:hypothetical protein
MITVNVDTLTAGANRKALSGSARTWRAAYVYMLDYISLEGLRFPRTTITPCDFRNVG